MAKKKKEKSLHVVLVKNHCFRAVVHSLAYMVYSLAYILESPGELLILLLPGTLNQNLWGWALVIPSI